MVLQWGKPAKIWGTDEPGTRISVRIAAVYSEAVTGEDGKWSVTLPVMRKSRNSLSMSVENDRGESIKINDVLVGDVWFMSGQSNMDLLMERARDRYPNEFSGCAIDKVRVFRIIENGVFGRELEEPETGSWKMIEEGMLPECSATVYFFAKYYTELTGIPVGVIHASLGGSLISTWMSREMLGEASDKMPDGYQQLLAEADRYASSEYLSSQLERNARNAADWNAALLQDEELNADKGFAGLPSGNIHVPCFFADVDELNGFTGLIKLKKTVSFTADEIKSLRKAKRIRLFMGTMADRDETYVNGVKVGDTGYQYPPRKYEVPPFILKEGENEVVIRLFVENGKGRLTPGKFHAFIAEGTEPLRIFNRKDHEEFEGEPVLVKDLEGDWEYQVMSKMPLIPETDFVNWHPTALYNGMAAPCKDYTTAGIIWYQGESNADQPYDYEDLMLRYIRGYRRDKKDEELPVVFVQLPNFVIDNEDDIRWPDIREKQRRCQYENNTSMVCAIDLGEDNDLHPTGKRELGRRLALSAAAIRKSTDKDASGPEPMRAEIDERDGGQVVVLKLSHADGLYAKSVCEDHRIVDFTVLTPGGRLIRTVAQIDEAAREILIRREDGESGNFTVDSELRYIDANTYRGDIIYNAAGLPLAPFRMKILGNWRNRKF